MQNRSQLIQSSMPLWTPQPDTANIKDKLAHATVITAQNDPIAPYQYAVAVANDINSKLILRPTGGHFLTSDGYQQFPLVLDELRNMVASEE